MIRFSALPPFGDRAQAGKTPHSAKCVFSVVKCNTKSAKNMKELKELTI